MQLFLESHFCIFHLFILLMPYLLQFPLIAQHPILALYFIMIIASPTPLTLVYLRVAQLIILSLVLLFNC